MEKKYQVFLSSTFKDLQHERQLAITEILKADCIPVGMELFPASHDDPLGYIKRVIDDSDYYLIIIGGRYGSEYEGRSFTEREFEYALSKGKKIVAFVHNNPSVLQPEKRDGQEKQKKLRGLKKRLEREKLVVHWERAEQLPEMILHALVRLQKDHQAEGWIRASAENFKKVAERGHEALVRKVSDLKARVARMKATAVRAPKNIGKQQEKLGLLVKARLTEIDAQAQELFGAKVLSSRTKSETTFSAAKIADSLSLLGVPMHISCEVVERCVDELKVLRRKSQQLSTSDIRRAVSEVLYRLEPDGVPQKRIQLWADNYIRVYGSPNRQVMVVDDTGKLEEKFVPLAFPLIQKNVLTDVAKSIYPEDFRSRIAAIHRQDRDVFAEDIVQHVKSLDIYRIHYSTLVSLARDLALSPPHPWFVEDKDIESALAYDLERARHHASRLREMLRAQDPQLGLHSMRECLHHSCSGILAMYRVLPGCGYLSPLYNLNHHLGEHVRGNPTDAHVYSDFRDLITDLDALRIPVRRLAADLQTAQVQVNLVDSADWSGITEISQLAISFEEILESLAHKKYPQTVALGVP